ncbi:MAG: tetratricopeptide repeat protein [Bacteroidales bacterium]
MKIVKLCLILFFSASQLFASVDSIYMQAVKLYEAGEFESALETWQRVVDSGYESPELYYNMGNAAFRSNSIGYAALYYEKALKLDPSYGDAAHNLEFLSRYKSDGFEEVPEFFIRTWISSTVKALPERTWSIMALAGFLFTVFFLLLYIFARGLTLKKTGFFAGLGGLIFTAFTLFSAVATYHEIIRPDSGIILSPSVTVKSTPSETGTELFILHEGTRVKVNEEVTGWHNIRIIDGREGWIRTGDFGTI